jgi:hypothetical protein
VVVFQASDLGDDPNFREDIEHPTRSALIRAVVGLCNASKAAQEESESLRQTATLGAATERLEKAVEDLQELPELLDWLFLPIQPMSTRESVG